MDYRCRLPGALYRRAVQRATEQGSDLQTIVRSLLTLYVADILDPCAADGIRSATAQRGGKATRRSASTQSSGVSSGHVSDGDTASRQSGAAMNGVPRRHA